MRKLRKNSKVFKSTFINFDITIRKKNLGKQYRVSKRNMRKSLLLCKMLTDIIWDKCKV